MCGVPVPFIYIWLRRDRLRGVVSRIPVFQPGCLGSTPSGIRDFNLPPGTECVFFVCILFCIVSGGGPNKLRPQIQFGSPLSSCQVFWSTVRFPLQENEPRPFLTVSFTLERENNRWKEKKKHPITGRGVEPNSTRFLFIKFVFMFSVKVKVTKAHGGSGYKVPHIHIYGTRKR